MQLIYVDPDKGGLHVEREGILEVRYKSDFEEFHSEPEDFYHFQQRVPQIPNNYFLKNKKTKTQAFFHCCLCNCQVQSLKSLEDHIRGTNHVKKVCEERRKLKVKEPQIAPKKSKYLKRKGSKTKKSFGVVVAPPILEDRLRKYGGPALGLEFITEFVNPYKMMDPPMYTCELKRCNLARSTSEDMFYHVTRAEHQKNFLMQVHPNYLEIAGLSRAGILIFAAQYEKENGGSEGRNYGVTNSVHDYSIIHRD